MATGIMHDDIRNFVWIIPAGIVAYILGSMYVYAPLKVKRRQIKNVHTDHVPIELNHLPLEVLQAFYAAAPALASCGFQSLGNVGHNAATTRQQGFVSLWTNAQTNDSAQIIGVTTPAATGGVKIVTLVTFSTEFTDDTRIVTSNSPSASVFPRDPRVSSVRCPGVWDVGNLYRFHRARVDRDSGVRRPTLQRVRDPLTRLQLEHRETYERLVKAGYFTLDATAQRYLPTLKGAYLMTYRLLPPFKSIQNMMKDSRANRALKQLGFGGLEPFRHAQPSAPPSGGPSAAQAPRA